MAARLLLAGLVLLLLAGCGGGGSDAEPADSEPKAEKTGGGGDDSHAEPEEPADDAALVEEQIRWRAAGLGAGDGAAMAQAASGRQRALDRLHARRADRIGAEDIEVTTDDVQVDGDRAKANAVLSYRINGMERGFLTLRKIELRKQGEKWRVVRDRPRDEPLPWEVADFEVSRSEHVVLLTDRGMDAGPLRAGLERAYRDIRRDLPARDLPGSVLVIGARDEPQTEKLTGRVAKGVVAVANVRVQFGPPPALEVERVFAQRMIVIGTAWDRMGAEEREATLVHEMTHTALNPDTSGRTPPWLVEGVAMHVAGEDRTQEALARAAGLAPAKRLAELCKPDSIFRLSGEEQGAAYAAASGAAEAIVAQAGTKGLFRLYDSYNDSRHRAGTCNKLTDKLLRRATGMSLAELESAVAGG